MLDVLQVRAVLLPTNITAELSCNSQVYGDLKDYEFLCWFGVCFFFFLLNLKCKAVQNLLLHVFVFSWMSLEIAGCLSL